MFLSVVVISFILIWIHHYSSEIVLITRIIKFVKVCKVLSHLIAISDHHYWWARWAMRPGGGAVNTLKLKLSLTLISMDGFLTDLVTTNFVLNSLSPHFLFWSPVKNNKWPPVSLLCIGQVSQPFLSRVKIHCAVRILNRIVIQVFCLSFKFYSPTR